MSSLTLRFLAEPSTVNFGGKVPARLACTGNSSMNISEEVRCGDIRAGTTEESTECVIVFVARDDHGKGALAANVRAQLTASRAHSH